MKREFHPASMAMGRPLMETIRKPPQEACVRLSELSNSIQPGTALQCASPGRDPEKLSCTGVLESNEPGRTYDLAARFQASISPPEPALVPYQLHCLRRAQDFSICPLQTDWSPVNRAISGACTTFLNSTGEELCRSNCEQSRRNSILPFPNKFEPKFHELANSGNAFGFGVKLHESAGVMLRTSKCDDCCFAPRERARHLLAR